MSGRKPKPPAKVNRRDYLNSLVRRAMHIRSRIGHPEINEIGERMVAKAYQAAVEDINQEGKAR